MNRFLHFLSYLQFPLFAGALYYYLRPFWVHEEILLSLNTALMLTGLALSFVSLVNPKASKRQLTDANRRILFWILMPSLLLMFGLSLFWYWQGTEIRSLGQSLLFLTIGMLSVLRVLSLPNDEQ